MATIITKNSSTASSVPTNAQLVQGELAVNVTDKRLFTENASGTVVELGTNPSSLTLPNGTANGVAYLNGSKVLTTGSSLQFDGSNLGLGVTPSAWGSGRKALDVNNASFYSQTGNYNGVASNAFNNGSNWIYKTTAAAQLYEQGGGTHAWFIAPSGTAGNTISFTQAMTLDASGNWLLGVTSASGAKLHAESTSDMYARIKTTGNSVGVGLQIQSPSRNFFIGQPYNAQGNLVFYDDTAGAERARIDSSGNLLVGTTSTTPTSGGLVSQFASGQSYFSIGHVSGTSSGSYYLPFYYNGTIIGGVTQNGTTGVLYNLTSDYRLKNNPTALTGAKDFVMALQPKTWDWWDGSGKGVGFIAHEFMEVAKYSGNGEKDAVDAEGNPVYQSIQPSSSEVMANLVALLQEQQAIIEQLKADVAALKGAA